MPNLDECINAIYEPGVIVASSGEFPTIITLLLPSLDFSKSQNSFYFMLLTW